MENDKKSLTAYLIAGLAIGAASFYLKNNMLSFGLMLIVLGGLHTVIKKTLKINEKFKWFLSNGGWIYVFVWFITWTILYNVIG